MLRSLLAAVMTCALVFSFVGCAEEPAEPVKPPVVDTKKAAEVKKVGEAAKTDVEKKAGEAADAAKKALEEK